MILLPFLISLCFFPTIFTNIFGFRLVGLTGGISTGKSTVTKTLKNLGIPVIDFDLIAREVVAPNSSCLKQIADSFGSVILNPDGSLNRTKLGEVIFSDPSKRKQLDGIMRRPIMYRFFWLLIQFFFLGKIPSKYYSNSDTSGPLGASHGISTKGLFPGLIQAFNGSKVVVLDCPLLFESGISNLCSSTVYVDCDEDVQLKRLVDRDGTSEEVALKKIKAQWGKEIKIQKSKNVIKNNGTIDELYTNIITWWNKMTRDEFGLYLVKPHATFGRKMDSLLQVQTTAQSQFDLYLKQLDVYKQSQCKTSGKDSNLDKGQKLVQEPQAPKLDRSILHPDVNEMLDKNTIPSFFQVYQPYSYCLKPSLLSSLFIAVMAIPSYFFIQWLEKSWLASKK